MRVWGVGLGAQALGFRVYILEFRVWGSGFGILGSGIFFLSEGGDLGFGFEGLRSGAQGLASWVEFSSLGFSFSV